MISLKTSRKVYLYQCDQIWLLLKGLLPNFQTKVAQMFVTFWAILKNLTFYVKTVLTTH